MFLTLARGFDTICSLVNGMEIDMNIFSSLGSALWFAHCNAGMVIAVWAHSEFTICNSKGQREAGSFVAIKDGKEIGRNSFYEVC
jgi:hypothetical protein